MPFDTGEAQPVSRGGPLGKAAVLVDVLFHAPSEHAEDGRRADGEVQFVHALDGAQSVSNATRVVVVAVLLDGGASEANPSMQFVVDLASGNKNVTQHFNYWDYATGLLPDNAGVGDYYFYNGSLTTPPCFGGVGWAVAKLHAHISDAQLGALTQFANRNTRPLQVK